MRLYQIKMKKLFPMEKTRNNNNELINLIVEKINVHWAFKLKSILLVSGILLFAVNLFLLNNHSILIRTFIVVFIFFPPAIINIYLNRKQSDTRAKISFNEDFIEIKHLNDNSMKIYNIASVIVYFESVHGRRINTINWDSGYNRVTIKLLNEEILFFMYFLPDNQTRKQLKTQLKELKTKVSYKVITRYGF